MKFELKHFVLLFALLGFVPILGCGPGENTSVTEDADAAQLAEYDRLMEESEEEAEEDGSE